MAGGSLFSGILARVAGNGAAGGGAGPMAQTPQEQAKARIQRLGLSPRQQQLSLLWAKYMGQEYENRKLDWDGTQHEDPVNRELIAQAAAMPPGWIEAGTGGMVPLKFRRPSSPYRLGKVIPNRFTGLLFSERRHPKIQVEGDPDTEAFVTACADAGRLWATMIIARTFGGATGSAAIGVKFVDGDIRFEAHDPVYGKPTFVDRDTLEVESFEIRYQFPKEVLDEANVWKVEPWWYRRVIDQNKDTLFEEVPVGDGEEPKWEVKSGVEHGFGFCPVVWIQNLPLKGSVDGIPDCDGCFDMMERIDALLSQADRGTIANCDPTLLLTSAQLLADIKKGSDNAIKLGEGGDGKYLEITGDGPKMALMLAMAFRQLVLEVAQCVLDDHGATAEKTATEIRVNVDAMWEKIDVLREQYGQKGVIPVLLMVTKMARKVMTPVEDTENGGTIVGKINLPQKRVGTGNSATHVPHKLGDDNGTVKLLWPPYSEPSPAETLAQTQATALAKQNGLIDKEHAAKAVAPNFRVEDVGSMMKKIDSEAAQRQTDSENQMMKDMRSKL